MTPALAHGLVLVCEVTRALMPPSPASGRGTSWTWSAVPGMSLPAPWMVHVPPRDDVLPASAGMPTSAQVHAGGQPPAVTHAPAPHTTQDRLDEKVPSVCTLATTVSPPVVDAGLL